MPQMCIHHHNRSCATGNDHLIGMILESISEHLLREFVAAMCGRNDPQRTIFKRDVLQHPQDVADPEPSRIRYLNAVADGRRCLD